MRLRLVTISGADDLTPPEKLAELSAEFPFVEWGLLASRRANPRPEFSSPASLRAIEEIVDAGPGPRMHCSGHVCGAWAVNICKKAKFPDAADRPLFERVQLNISHVVHKVRDLDAVARCLPRGREYIVQVGEQHHAGIALARGLVDRGTSASVLFDCSGGRGVAPTDWPALEPDLACGFAVGLRPSTLAEELARLENHVGPATIWVDMQKYVRSDEGARLDLDRVRRCLEIAARFVELS